MNNTLQDACSVNVGGAYVKKVIAIMDNSPVIVWRKRPPPAGTSSIFAENTWTTIANTPKPHLYWDIGDIKDAVLATNEVLTMQIYGFNHDTLANGNIAPLTLGTRDLMADRLRMNNIETPDGGWPDFDAFGVLQNEIFQLLPQDLQQLILPARKIYNVGNDLHSVDCKLFQLSHTEAHSGASSSSPSGQGATYPIFTDNPSRMKRTSNGDGEPFWWYTRSRHSNGRSMMIFLANGSRDASGMTSRGGVCFGFCMGNM